MFSFLKILVQVICDYGAKYVVNKNAERSYIFYEFSKAVNNIAACR